MHGESTANGGEADSGGTLTFLDAAERVLRENGAPLHYRAITEKAISEGLLASSGASPHNTMSAQIGTDIKKADERGTISRFVKDGSATYGLSDWGERGLRREIDDHNKQVKEDLLKRIRGIPPGEFEDLVGELLTALGFEKVDVSVLSGDGGVDVRGTLVVGDVLPIKMAVQAKRWKANVQAPTVQQVRGSLGAHEQGLIVTTSGFSAGAREEAQKADAAPVGLMDGETLVELLAANDIMSRRTSMDIVELEDEDEEEEDA